MEQTGASLSADEQLSVFFLAEGEQSAESVMERLAGFIRAAERTLDFALYDLRLSDALKQRLVAALQERAAAGVRIRICYDGD
jgi:phosphatidylserine/phosphatidylglycerophosphate/cardiolipin synthase-like enzyme